MFIFPISEVHSSPNNKNIIFIYAYYVYGNQIIDDNMVMRLLIRFMYRDSDICDKVYFERLSATVNRKLGNI